MSLLRAREAVMNRFRSSLRLFNITEQQWRVLRALSSVESMEATELAHVTCLLAPSLSRIVRDLEERGLVTRSAVPQDLRRARITITSQGLTLIDAVAPYSESIYEEITRTFGTEKMELLQSLLKELVDELEALPPIVYGANEISVDLSQRGSTQQRGRPRNKAPR